MMAESSIPTNPKDNPAINELREKLKQVLSESLALEWFDPNTEFTVVYLDNFKSNEHPVVEDPPFTENAVYLRFTSKGKS